MWRVRELIGADDIDPERQWLLLDDIYAVSGPVTATAAIGGAAAVGWQDGCRGWALTWGLSAVVILAMRLALSRAYRTRRGVSSPRLWSDLFLVAACCTGLHWGFGGFGIILAQSGGTQGTIFGVECAILAGAAARTYVHPGATIAQVSICATMLAVCSPISHLWMYSLLMVLYIVYQTSCIMKFGDITLNNIKSNQERRKLLMTLEAANEQLAEANARLATAALTDALTGVRNRRGFDQDLDLTWRQASAADEPLAMLFIDVDHFKRFNDRYGHPAGDACLVLVAAAIDAAVAPASARVARYGGEEFAVLLPDTDLPEACFIAEQVAIEIRAIDLGDVAGPEARITASVGIASLRPSSGTTTLHLTSLADQALYRAKQDGRDCIRHSREADIVAGRHGSRAAKVA